MTALTCGNCGQLCWAPCQVPSCVRDRCRKRGWVLVPPTQLDRVRGAGMPHEVVMDGHRRAWAPEWVVLLVGRRRFSVAQLSKLGAELTAEEGAGDAALAALQLGGWGAFMDHVLRGREFMWAKLEKRVEPPGPQKKRAAKSGPANMELRVDDDEPGDGGV